MVLKVKRSQELLVELGDTVGSGARLFNKLKESDVNILANCCYQIEDRALFNIIPDDIERAKEVLGESNFKTTTKDILLVEMPNKPGALAEVLQKISEIGVSVSSAYATTTSKDQANVVLKTEDDGKVIEALED